MKKNLGLIALVLGFVILIVGAYVLYDKLAPENAPDQLITMESTTEPSSERETTEPSMQTEPSSQSDPTESSEMPLAPDFTVYDLEGNAVKLSDFFGKPIVLNFWASWCGPCCSEMPEFDAVSQELQGEVTFLMVNMTDGGQETVETASALIAQEGYQFPVYYDTDMDAATVYGVYSLPTTYFINADGVAIAQATGAIDRETLQRGIDMIR